MSFLQSTLKLYSAISSLAAFTCPHEVAVWSKQCYDATSIPRSNVVLIFVRSPSWTAARSSAHGAVMSSGECRLKLVELDAICVRSV